MVVEYETQGRTAVITMNRPEVRNAVSAEVANGIENALNRFEENPDLWVAILTANGRAFCAGADLKEIAAGRGHLQFTERGGFAGISRRVRTKPLIAAITGSALAGGTEIALCCDMIVCSDETAFGLPEVKRSLVAGAGGLFRLPRAIGMAAALEAILTGDPLPAQRAYQLGMVNKVVPTDMVLAEAHKLAERIIVNAPLAVQASRRVATRALFDNDEALWRASEEAFQILSQTEDFAEGPRAFIEKRPAKWTGR